MEIHHKQAATPSGYCSEPGEMRTSAAAWLLGKHVSVQRPRTTAPVSVAEDEGVRGL